MDETWLVIMALPAKRRRRRWLSLTPWSHFWSNGWNNCPPKNGGNTRLPRPWKSLEQEMGTRNILSPNAIEPFWYLKLSEYSPLNDQKELSPASSSICEGSISWQIHMCSLRFIPNGADCIFLNAFLSVHPSSAHGHIIS